MNLSFSEEDLKFQDEVRSFIAENYPADIKNKMDNGDLIEDTVVISVLKEKVNSLSNEQILIDGFPRSSIQADSLLEIFDNKELSIINFEVDDDQLLQRIKKRSMEESRADDSFFEKRLQIYKKSRDPGLNHEPQVVFYAEFESGIGIGWKVDKT